MESLPRLEAEGLRFDDTMRTTGVEFKIVHGTDEVGEEVATWVTLDFGTIKQWVDTMLNAADKLSP